MITAARLHDHVSRPRSVDLDAHGDQSLRGDLGPFVKILLRRASALEAMVVAGLPDGTLRLAGLSGDVRERETLLAMKAVADIIQGGRIGADDLLGDPDPLIRKDGAYVAADIKSGRAEQGGADEGDGRPKAHHAVQVAMYCDILERMGRS